MHDYKLQAVYGKSRLVLLPVHPYLIHAYWEIALEDFDRAKKEVEEAQEVLRFYKRGMGRESSLTDSFDVEINLQAGNWYVHLWSAEESYFADLGIKSKDGTFVHLVRSRVVHMPRPHPAIAIDQRFMKVESAARHAEIVPPPVVEHVPPKVPAASPALKVINRTPIPRLGDSEEIVRERLDHVYVSPQSEFGRSGSDDANATRVPTAPAPTPNLDLDLAAMAERNLVAAPSSASFQTVCQHGAPDSEK